MSRLLPRNLATALVPALFAFFLITPAVRASDWAVTDAAHPTQSGRVVDVTLQGLPVARLVYGSGQPKPYLHVFGEAGELLTKGESSGLFPHHRAIFIGWNQIASALGTKDLWHMTSGTMQVVGFDALVAGPESATIIARIEWRANAADPSGSNLLLTEQRTLVISRPGGERTQVDVFFRLTAARALTLGGDLQHAGIHFRAAQEVANRDAETSYLSSPAGALAGGNLEWCRLLFPLGSRWYTSVQMNSPANPVEELSMRAYGRFGYFFEKTLRPEETLALTYRFVTETVEAPASPPAPSSAQIAASRARMGTLFAEFAAFQLTDADADGQSTADELIAGTNPYDPVEVFAVSAGISPETGRLHLRFPSRPWKTYGLLTSPSLESWAPVAEPAFTQLAPNFLEWTESKSPGPAARFYRVTVESVAP